MINVDAILQLIIGQLPKTLEEIEKHAEFKDEVREYKARDEYEELLFLKSICEEIIRGRTYHKFFGIIGGKRAFKLRKPYKKKDTK